MYSSVSLHIVETLPDWNDNQPRQAHNPGDCQLCYDPYKMLKTAGAAMWGLVDDWPDRSDVLDIYDVQELVNDYFAANPEGVITIGNYTPRGRKRRGLPRTRRPMLSLRLGTVRHYFPTFSYMGVREVTVRADRITVRCRCKGADRPNLPQHTTLWSRPA